MTADQKHHVLLRNELSTCVVTMQNPFEIAVEIESICLVTSTDGDNESIEIITSDFKPTILGPMSRQQVYVSVSPSHDKFAVGDFFITGCRVKMQSCQERFFPIVKKPWVTPMASTMPHIQLRGPELEQVAISTAMSMPLLVVESDPRIGFSFSTKRVFS